MGGEKLPLPRLYTGQISWRKSYQISKIHLWDQVHPQPLPLDHPMEEAAQGDSAEEL